MPSLALLALPLCLAASGPPETIEAFGYTWNVPTAYEWSVEGSGKDQVLRMLVARPSTQPRRPAQHAIAATSAYSDVTLEADVKRDKTSLILVYAWKDENHFNYAHLSVDAPSKQPVHNGIFHVFGGDRVRISNENGPGALPSADWTHVKLSYTAKSGEVWVEVNGQRMESLHAIDVSLGPGRVGIGSFFETAQFRNVKITGVTAK